MGHSRTGENTLGASFYRGSDGALLVYDVTNEKSTEQLSLWRDELIQRVEDDNYYFPIVVVGNKTDLLPKEETVISDNSLSKEDPPILSPDSDIKNLTPEVDVNEDCLKEKEESSPAQSKEVTPPPTCVRAEVKKWATANGYGHVETSAKDGNGVTAAIIAIVALTIEQLRESGRMEQRIAESKKPKNNNKTGKKASRIEVLGQKYSNDSSNCC